MKKQNIFTGEPTEGPTEEPEELVEKLQGSKAIRLAVIYRGIKRYWKFAVGFLTIMVISAGGFFIWSGHFGLAATAKNFAAQVSDFFSEIIGTDQGFQLIGQVSLEDAANAENQSKNFESTGSPAIKQCSFATYQSPSHQKIIINEVAWMGTTNSANDEWIELKNISQANVDISGWQLLDKDEQIKIIFPAGSRIPAAGFYLLERNEDAVPNIKADILYTGNLKNSDEGIRLFDANCNLVDEVLANPNWPAGDNSTKKTMERGTNLDWYTSNVINGTPKKENSPAPPISKSKNQNLSTSTAAETNLGETADNLESSDAAASSNTQPTLCSQENLGQSSQIILINEVAWAGISSDKTTKEWIELKNNTSQIIDLNGWQLVNKSATIKIFFNVNDKMPAAGYFLLERSSDETVTGIKAEKIFSGAVKNSDESLRLFDQNCRLVDEVLANPNWPAGGASPDYRSAERTSNLSWQTYSGSAVNGIFGTPKAENSKPPLSQSSSYSSAPTPPAVYYSLVITKTGDGSGSIISNPPGIDCGNNCNEDFVSGTTITLSAIPSADSSFTGWSGGCSGVGECVITTNNNISVGVAFSLLTPASPPSGVNHIVISEIMVGMEDNADYEFIELYNPTSATIDLTGWSIKRKSSSGAEYSLLVSSRLEGKVVSANKYFLAVNEGGYNGLITPDVAWATSNKLAYENNAVVLYNASGEKIEEVSWIEIPKGQSYERLSWENNEFVIQASPNPQNSTY